MIDSTPLIKAWTKFFRAFLNEKTYIYAFINTDLFESSLIPKPFRKNICAELFLAFEEKIKEMKYKNIKFLNQNNTHEYLHVALKFIQVVASKLTLDNIEYFGKIGFELYTEYSHLWP